MVESLNAFFSSLAFIIDVLVTICTLLGVSLLILQFRQTLYKELEHKQLPVQIMTKMQQLIEQRAEELRAAGRLPEDPENPEFSLEQIHADLVQNEKQLLRFKRLIRALNIGTSILILAVNLSALVSLFFHQGALAVTLSLGSVVVLVITKGGIFLLTYVLKPIAIGALQGIGGLAVKELYDRWKKQRSSGPAPR